MRRAPSWRLTAMILACGCAQQVTSSGLTVAEEDIVLRYLDCVDCVVPLDSVRALAGRKVEATVDSLYRGLLYGPGLSAITAAETVLRNGFIRDSTWRAQNGLPLLLNRDSTVAEARNRFVYGYQSRGAYGLGWIHTPRAVALLDSALLAPNLPAVVKQAVRYALDSLPPP